VTAAHEMKRQRVLLVDDDVHVSKALARLLRRFCDVEIVPSIAEAQRLLTRDSAFALVLCDLLLADGNGLDLYRWMLSTGSTLTARVAFMTGLGDDAPEAEEFSEVPCLGKPLDIERVRALLAN
jgi:DNA-binding NtrC family response regulator